MDISRYQPQTHSLTIRKCTFAAKVIAGVFFVLCASIFSSFPASAATLNVSPASGTFVVGSTFSVTVLLDTENETINTVGTTITFPADRVQLVSPSTGNSIISIWTTLPKVDNQRGIVQLQGGVPGGIKSTGAAITTLTFRVTSVGSAVIKFTDASKVLLHNGLGTDALRQVNNGVYTLVLPPPAGPVVSSITHPDQTQWYPTPTAVLNWAPEQNVDGYSYMLSDNPTDIPDDINDGKKQSVTYKNLSDGVHFFHIKAITDGSWGGVTHFAIKIDTTPPAAFPIDIIPDKRTSRREPIFQFASTDAASGISHYDMMLVPLFVTPDQKSGNPSQPLFIEVSSPYVSPELSLGNYNVVIRAYDVAGNYRESVQRMSVVSPFFSVVAGEGLRLFGSNPIPWIIVWILLGILIGIMGTIAWRLRRWHHTLRDKRTGKELPDKVQRDLEELKKFRSKYGRIAAVIGVIALLGLSIRTTNAESVNITPPIIDTLSNNITNEDIFYVGGKSDTAGSTITIYLQNLTTGETVTEEVKADNHGAWFYRHNTFLSSGNYVLWTQSKIGDEESPPSPQEALQVRTTAIHLGSSRLSVETIYFTTTIIGFVALLLLIIYTIHHAHHGKRHKKALLAEIRNAEDAVRRGFAVIRHDIQSEIETVRKMKVEKELSSEEKAREEQLLKDLEAIEQNIGKEIWEIDQMEAGGQA